MSHTNRAKYAPRQVMCLAREVRAEIIETEIERDDLCWGPLDCANYGARCIADRAARWGVAPRAVGVDAEITVERAAREHDTAAAARVAAWEEAECWERDYLEHAREQDRAREDEYLYFMMEMDDQ